MCLIYKSKRTSKSYETTLIQLDSRSIIQWWVAARCLLCMRLQVRLEINMRGSDCRRLIQVEPRYCFTKLQSRWSSSLRLSWQSARPAALGREAAFTFRVAVKFPRHWTFILLFQLFAALFNSVMLCYVMFCSVLFCSCDLSSSTATDADTTLAFRGFPTSSPLILGARKPPPMKYTEGWNIHAFSRLFKCWAIIVFVIYMRKVSEDF